MSRPPEFDELVGAEVGEEERRRLRRAHDLLVEAGPPAELPPWLEQPPTPWVTPIEQARERRGQSGRWRMVLIAAALALTGFVVGSFVSGGGSGERGFAATRIVELRGTPAAPRALAAVKIGKRDAGGNWPMILDVGGLKPQPADGYYTLALLRDGRPVVPCGTFRVDGTSTSVRLNAPYDLREYDGWVVTEFEPGGSHELSKQQIVLRS
jgi:anti-sigma-K factor RskA